MMSEETTTPSVEADVENIDSPQVAEEDQHVEETTVDEYSKAWEDIDVTEPPAELFGETTETEKQPEPASEESQVNEKSGGGLYIENPVLKYKGKEIPVDSADELLAFAMKGFKFEREMSKIKPYKSYIAIIDENNITLEDIKALGDMKAGNKSALDYLKKSAGIEDEPDNQFGSSFFDAQEENTTRDEYRPEVPQTDPVAEIFSSFTEEYPEAAGKVAAAYDEIDNEFKAQIYNPDVFPRFIESVVSGEFDKVYPVAMKIKAMNGQIPWLQAYMMAGQQLAQGKNPDQRKEPPEDTGIPGNTDSGRRVNKKLDYDAAFNMSLEELENKLFEE